MVGTTKMAHYTNTALTCSQCSVAPMLVESQLTLHSGNSRMHCPCCGDKCKGEQTDVHHIQAVNCNVSYLAVKLGLQCASQYFDSNPSKRHAHTATRDYNIPNPGSPEHDTRIQFEDQFLTNLKAAAATMQEGLSDVTHGVCYVNGTCTTCAATFTITRNVPHADAGTLEYCPYCGSKSLALSTNSTEETSWHVLAKHYNMHVAALQFLYKEWVTNSMWSSCHTFASFLEAFAQKAQAEVSAQHAV
jgi:DNA-directed RNA polymerase subunit RPC12/RpoP